jgi:hypothetical protein
VFAGDPEPSRRPTPLLVQEGWPKAGVVADKARAIMVRSMCARVYRTTAAGESPRPNCLEDDAHLTWNQASGTGLSRPHRTESNGPEGITMPIPNAKGSAVARFAATTCLLVAALILPGGVVPGALHAAAVPVQNQEAPHPTVSQGEVPSPSGPPDINPSPLTPKQQRAVLKANFAKMKEDADQLADLAKALQEDLNKSNENVLSLGVVEKADKIEKLAKKIKSAAVQ